MRCLVFLLLWIQVITIVEAVWDDARNVEKYSGTAVTVMLGSPKWFQNRFTIMINQIMISLPQSWLMQIFYMPSKKMSKEAVSYNGIQSHIKKGRIKLVAIPGKKVRKRNLLLSPFFWENIPTERVLLFGGNSVICANSPYVIDDFRGYDMVSGRGASGLSLRSKSASLFLINSKGGESFASNTVGTEDSVFKAHLTRVAPKEVADIFGVAPDGTGSLTPFSISGVMSELNDTLRTMYIEYCPEIKMLFPTLHNGKCFGAEPRPLECFRYLCERGGLKCGRMSEKDIEWKQKLKDETQTLRLHLTVER